MKESLLLRGVPIVLSRLLHKTCAPEVASGGRAMSRTLAVAIFLGIIGACVAAPATSLAHAIILESEPHHEETVLAPKRLVLRFNSRLEKPLCSVQLVGPRRRSIALFRQEADAAPDTLVYMMPPLEPGEYRARWKVMAADGHVTEGTVVFTVVAPTAR
ncbi:MAG TPA: copper resistance protein CopC [Candidatus Bathyarchaeia archaeon]|nr:copper resistance protein CopC [Candidatus Bathyarchaeia archaeon]